MNVPSQLALKTHTTFGCAASLATLDKLVDRFSRPPIAPTIGDTSLTHVMRLAAHSTTSPTPTTKKNNLQIISKEEDDSSFKIVNAIVVCLEKNVSVAQSRQRQKKNFQKFFNLLIQN
jgi:hypothetical protein